MATKADDEALEPLFAAPPQQFTAVRAQVVEALRRAGEVGRAREVAALRRPTASVWAVNQVARRERAAVAELLTLGAAVRRAEQRLMRGGDGAAFMDELRRERQQVAALTRRAAALLAESGQPVGPALTRRIGQTLHAAAVSDDQQTRAAVAAGRLTHDLSPPNAVGAPSRPAGGRAPKSARPARSPVERASRAGVLAATHTPARPPADAETPADAPSGARAPARALKSAAATRKRQAAAVERAAMAERRRTARLLREQRRAQAAARKRAAALARRVAAADRLVAERRRAVERARAVVATAEQSLRAAKDALVDAELAAAAARRAAADAAV